MYEYTWQLQNYRKLEKTYDFYIKLVRSKDVDNILTRK